MRAGIVAALGVAATLACARSAVDATRAGAVVARFARAPAHPTVAARSGSRGWWSGGERRRVVRELPDVVEDVARSLRSGASLRMALAEAAGHARAGARGDVALVVERVERGQPLVAALDEWARLRPLPEVRLVVAALGLGLEAGAASARTVDGLAATLRERSAVAGEVSAQATQARLSALVISVLPLAFTTWTCATDRRIADFLFATPAGWACLIGGLSLNALGALWMRRITRSVS